jgi:hypothetical protein
MVVGIAMVKDEADIIERTVEHMAYQCDALFIADNGSTDGTVDALLNFGFRWGHEPSMWRLTEDSEPGYYQSRKMSALAEEARRQGATWVLPFDSDERWLADGIPIRELLPSLPADVMTCEADVFDHVATGDPEMPWRRREQLPLRKVACRAVEGLVIHQGNHGATFPGRDVCPTVTGQLQVRHFPYRTPQQFIRKVRNGAAAYRATDLDESVGSHWRSYDRLTDAELHEVFYRWFHSADPENDPELIHDPCPVLSRS